MCINCTYGTLGSSLNLSSLEDLTFQSASPSNIGINSSLADSLSANFFRTFSSLIDTDSSDRDAGNSPAAALFEPTLTHWMRLGKSAIAFAPQLATEASIATEVSIQQNSGQGRLTRPVLTIEPVDSDQSTEPSTQQGRDPERLIRPILPVEPVNSYPEIAVPVIAPIPISLVTIDTLLFSGKEGDTGTFQVKLNLDKAPTSNITLAFTPGSFLVVDADGNRQNGTQNFVTFTPQTWNQIQTVWFIAEVDGVATDRLIGNTIDYQLSGGVSASGTYDLGSITNTYAPDTSRFNIDLDFRNDTSGFWTLERRAIAQKASTDWSNRIANEWTGLQLNGTINKLQAGSSASTAFQTRRYVDDVVVFVNTINSNGTAGGYGGIEYDYGGWITSADLMPRVGQIAIDEAVSNTYLYNAVSHELGHTLGLLGLNWEGYLKQDFTTPQTAVFKGEYSTALNGGQYIPLQSQDGANPVTQEYDYWHPAAKISSIMSYQWLYYLPGPTEMDFAMLADSGYRVYGINTPFPPVVPVVVVPPVAQPTTSTNSPTVLTVANMTVAKGEPLSVQEEQTTQPASIVLQGAPELTQKPTSVLQTV